MAFKWDPPNIINPHRPSGVEVNIAFREKFNREIKKYVSEITKHNSTIINKPPPHEEIIFVNHEPKEVFKWPSPKPNSWIKEYHKEHLKPPIHKIKLKYLQFRIMDINDYYRHELDIRGIKTGTEIEHTWETLRESIKKEGIKVNIRVNCDNMSNGDIHLKVIDGNHRCNILADMYGMDHQE